MSASALRSVVESVLADPLFQLGSTAMEDAKKLANSILKRSTVENNDAIFEEFATSLMGALESACEIPGDVKRHSTRRERFWATFHSKQIHELPTLWSSLIRNLSCPEVTQGGMVLLTQHVNQKLFEMVLSNKFQCSVHPLTEQPLTAGEANALRYAAGYVPFALKKKLSHRPEFVKCLDQLAVSGEGETYLEYTKKWIELVNRGKLFEINDECFKFFCDLESKVTSYLRDIFASGGQVHKDKKEVISSIAEDTDVQFSWLLLCLELDDEQLSNELLEYVVELWLTIRGFSMASAWMEYIKQCDSTSTTKKKALRKNLKQKRLQLEES